MQRRSDTLVCMTVWCVVLAAADEQNQLNLLLMAQIERDPAQWPAVTAWARQLIARDALLPANYNIRCVRHCVHTGHRNSIDIVPACPQAAQTSGFDTLEQMLDVKREYEQRGQLLHAVIGPVCPNGRLCDRGHG
jgi:hypothetical protein